MKKIHLLALICLCSMSLIAQVNHTITFKKDFNVFTDLFKDGNLYSQIEWKDLESYTKEGYPVVPVKYVRLIIPYNAKANSVKISANKTETLNLNAPLLPGQLPVPIAIGVNEPDFIPGVQSIYSSSNPYPENSAEIIEENSSHGNKIVTLAIFPFQYVPAKNQLIYSSEVQIELQYSVTNSAKIENRVRKDNEYKKVLTQMVDNKTDVDKYNIYSITDATQQSSGSTLKAASIAPVCEYVIVTPAAFAPGFNNFIAWKKQKGIDVSLVTTETIYANYSGDLISGINDNAGKIRQFLNDCYSNGTKYALLGGDYSFVPIRYAYNSNTTIDDNYIIPTDLYFSDFEGDWNVDGDARYGEPADAVDYDAEIYVGRLLCTNTSEINNWFNKVKQYENNPGNGDFNYLTKAFFTQADQLQRDNQANYVLNKTNWLTVRNVFEEQGGYCTTFVPTFPTGNDVISEFNNHYGLCSFMAHGNPSGVGVATLYINHEIKCDNTINDGPKANSKRFVTSFDSDVNDYIISESANGLDNMTNYNYPSINYSISCETTPFDDFGTPSGSRNMGETYTAVVNGGGPVYLGNTRYGWVGTSYILFGYFIDQLKAGQLQIGVAEAISKTINSDRYLRYSHNLVGCPETPFWLGIPQTMYLSVDYTLNKVRFLSAYGTAVAGAKVSFNYSGTWYFAETDANGYANAPYDITEIHDIGGSKPGYLPVYTTHISSNSTYTQANPIRGNLFINSGKTLYIAGNLSIPKYSKLIIEDQSTVYVNSGYTLKIEGDVELRGSSAKLVVNGNVEVNGNINISGGGYIVLNGNLNATTGSALNITGGGKTTKLIEIQKSMVFSANLTSVTIKNGKIVMANTSSEMIFTSPTSNVTLENVLATSASGSYLACNGVRMNTIKNITITNSTFQNVTYGLYLSRLADQPVANISGSTFQNCQTGLLVYHNGATISNCSFTGNSAYGLNGVTLEKPLNCYSSTFTSNTSYGLTMTGTSASGVLLNSCTVSSNANGVQVSGPLTLKVICGSISSNTYNGVTLTNSALIDANGANLGNNKVNIYGFGPTNSTSYNSFALKDGENDLRDNGTAGSYCMSGRFWAFTGGQVEANNNWWKNGGGAPVNNTDYSITGSAGALTLTDNSPNITYVPCSSPGYATTLMASAGLTDNYSYQTVTTSLGSTPLNTTVETILNDDPQKATVYDNYTRFELLNEVLDNKLRKPNEGEMWYFEKAYSEMKSQIGKPTKDGEPLFKGPELSKARNKAKTMGKNRKAWKGQKETTEFRALVDEASLLAFEGRYGEAIALLQNNRASLATDDAAYLDIIICHLNVDKTVAEGNDSLLVDEEYALCEKCGGNLKSGDTNEGSSSGAEQVSDGFNPQSGLARIEIVPNPVNGTSNIEITLPGLGVTAKVVVYNSAGQQVMEQVLNTGNSKIEVNNHNLPAGLYLVNLVVDGQTVADEKMVVME